MLGPVGHSALPAVATRCLCNDAACSFLRQLEIIQLKKYFGCCRTTLMFITVFTKFRHCSPPSMFIQCSGYYSIIPSYTIFRVGRVSAVVVATRYRLGGAKVSHPVQTGPRANPASYRTGAGSFAEVKRPGHGVDHHTHLVPRLKNEWSYTYTSCLCHQGRF